MEEKIIAILNGINEDIESYTGTNMMADEIIDSFELIEIISQLEDTFDIEIDAAEVSVENFANKDSIITLVKQLIDQ